MAVLENVRKIDLSNEVSKKTGLNLPEAAELVDMFLDIMSDGIARDKEVKVMGLGTFQVKHKDSRVGRNPKTGEVANIAERNVISFRPAKNLRKSFK